MTVRWSRNIITPSGSSETIVGDPIDIITEPYNGKVVKNLFSRDITCKNYKTS